MNAFSVAPLVLLSLLPFACSAGSGVNEDPAETEGDSAVADSGTLADGGSVETGVAEGDASNGIQDAGTVDTGPQETGVVTGDAGNTTLGQPGVWTNVTPAAISLNPAAFNNDNFGINDVLADPARPSDFYAFTCHQGVWKSTDYGQSWTKINTGSNGSELDKAKLWTAAIDPDRT
ncbi:MAG: hypothetical protein KBF88_10100, partial [Polyangiaceae bacterium]|nr:hypothetical protein [Polyangiaceae bacterium]